MEILGNSTESSTDMLLSLTSASRFTHKRIPATSQNPAAIVAKIKEAFSIEFSAEEFPSVF